MPFALGTVAGHLCAFGEICDIEIEDIAVGHTNDFDDAIHDPRCPLDIIEPDQIGPAQVMIARLAYKARIAAGGGGDGIEKARAIGTGKGVAHGLNGDHICHSRKQHARAAVQCRSPCQLFRWAASLLASSQARRDPRVQAAPKRHRRCPMSPAACHRTSSSMSDTSAPCGGCGQSGRGDDAERPNRGS